MEVPVPPFEIPKTPETSEPKAKGPMAREPFTDLTLPVPKLAMVVEPLARTVKSWALEEDETVKIGVVGRVEEPWTVRSAVGEVEFKAREVPLSYKREMPVVEAPVYFKR